MIYPEPEKGSGRTKVLVAKGFIAALSPKRAMLPPELAIAVMAHA